MSSMSLLTVKPPEWAVNVPESKWIEELLQEVRKNKNENIKQNAAGSSAK